jgi:hypothetical protein
MLSFKQYLNEMTAVLADMSFPMESYRKHIEKTLFQTGKKLGEIEEFDLFNTKLDGYDLFGLYQDTKLVSLVTGKKITVKNFGRVFEVNGMVTHKNHQGKALTSKIFMYLKSRKKWKILIGDLISKANRKNLEKLANSESFDLKWLNLKSGELISFKDANNFNEHGRPTVWQVLIENSNDVELIIETKTFNKNYSNVDLYDFTIFNGLNNAII